MKRAYEWLPQKIDEYMAPCDKLENSRMALQEDTLAKSQELEDIETKMAKCTDIAPTASDTGGAKYSILRFARKQPGVVGQAQ